MLSPSFMLVFLQYLSKICLEIEIVSKHENLVFRQGELRETDQARGIKFLIVIAGEPKNFYNL